MTVLYCGNMSTVQGDLVLNVRKSRRPSDLPPQTNTFLTTHSHSSGANYLDRFQASPKLIMRQPVLLSAATAFLEPTATLVSAGIDGPVRAWTVGSDLFHPFVLHALSETRTLDTTSSCHNYMYVF